MKYLLAGLLAPLFWLLVMWLTRRYAPSLMTPVGVSLRRLFRRKRVLRQ